MYGAELVAERRLRAVYAAAGAVDHFRCDGYSVELRPKDSGFLPQSTAICKCCDSGIAGFAVQSAAAYQPTFVFHNFLRKLEVVKQLRLPLPLGEVPP